ncbi:MAG: hypothetical protein ACXWC7_19400, partial [Chitinophagaceae bacterium]
LQKRNLLRRNNHLSKNMKLLRFVAYLFFRYYSEGKHAETEGMALFRAKGSMTLFLFLNFLTILVLFDNVGILPDSKGSKTERRLIMGLILLPFYLILTVLVRMKHVKQLRESMNMIRTEFIMQIFGS